MWAFALLANALPAHAVYNLAANWRGALVAGGITQVVTGDSHTCALFTSGKVRCWGEGDNGRLGYGNTNDIGDNETPASQPFVILGGDAIQIAAGSYHTCALLSTGAVRCWGFGNSGRLGYGNTNNIGDDETPASAGDVNIGGIAIQISAGDSSTCALLSTHRVRCWGSGGNGRLGYGNTNTIGDNEAPSTAGDVTLGGDVIQISLGSAHACALLSAANVRCWGTANSGRLGYGNTNNIGDTETPASAGDVNVGGSVVSITTGTIASCALLATRRVRCWGNAGLGTLGYGNLTDIGDNEAPATAGDVTLGGDVVQMTLSGNIACAVLSAGNLRCWGFGANGRLGYGNTNNIGDTETPASAGDVTVGGEVRALGRSPTSGHVCVILSTGKLRCWGYANNGRLGYGNVNDIGDTETPASAGDVDVAGPAPLSNDGVQLDAGAYSSCVLLSDGKVRCWGQGTNGALGYANTTGIGDDETPASAGNVTVGGEVIQVVSGETHSCALLANGKVRCWGLGANGVLGYSNTATIGDNETPASAGDVNIGGDVIQLAAGAYHTCALLSTARVRCWGNGSQGKLGYSSVANVGDDETPASAGDVTVGGDVIQITAGFEHTCALLSTSRVQCWGKGTFGRLGYGNTNMIGDNETPASAGDVTVGGDILQVSAGTYHTCALLGTGAVRCWGYGTDGVLGYGNTNHIGDNETPASAGDVTVGGAVVQIHAGAAFACVLLADRAVRCWGSGMFSSGRLGYGHLNNIGDNETPASEGDVPLLDKVKSLSVGRFSSCVFLATGAMQCWGNNFNGELGLKHTNDMGDDETAASGGKVTYR